MTDLWELPAGWRWTTMGEVAKVVGGSTPKTGEPSYWGGDIPWITPDDLSGFSDKYIERGRRSITQAGYGSCSAQMVPAGTVLFTSRAPIGYVAIAANPVCTNQGFKSFVCGEDADAEYVYWYLRASVNLARSLASGTTFLELSGKAAARMPIPLPPLDEQRRIVGAVEAQMTRLEAGSVDIVAARKRVRGYRTQVLARAAASEDGWMVERLGDLLTSLRNGLSHKPEGSDGVPILRISSVRAMSVDLEDTRFLDRDKADDAFLVREGDLLFTRYNGNPELVGVCGRVKGLRRPTLHPDKVIRGRVDMALADPEYLEIALNTGVSREHIRRAVKTTAGQAGIAGADLKAAPVPLPPLALQRRIAEAVQAELAIATEVDRSLGAAARRARALSQAVLDAAFSGRLS